MILSNDTICAMATAQGGAIAIVRISGPMAIKVTDDIFRGRRTIADTQSYGISYGKIIDDCQSTVDDVLVSVFRNPHSYTGEDSVEISCHASSFIVQQILTLLYNKGCRQANPGEFTQRAYLNGKMDLSQAEAVADLIASQNATQHRVAMSQMRGGISKKLADLRNRLLHLTSLLELELDFSDHEELEFADRTELMSIAKAVEQEIQHLSSSFATGNAIKNGIPVAIIGAPNVGKSTLLNALLQEDKAIVSDIQGTTRDTIEDTTYIVSPESGSSNGALFRFIDTAGIRHTEDKIESLGIERSLKAAEKAQIILLMTEPGVPFPDIFVRDDQTVIKIINKSDAFQALGGLGLDWLKLELLKTLPDAHCSSGDVLVTNIRHKQALDLALNDIHRSIEAMEYNMPGDLISEDLRQCLNHLAEIIGGAITPNEVLGNIFKHFCIGK